MRRELVVLVLALAVGCASVPLGTLWALRNLTPETLLVMDPRDMMAAVQIDERVALDAGATTLNFTVGSDEEPEALKYAVPLREHATGTQVFGLPPARAGHHWFVLGLTGEGAQSVQRMQGELNGRLDDYSRLTIAVNPRFGGDIPPEIAATFPVQLWVQLTPVDGFLKLFDDRLDLSGGSGR